MPASPILEIRSIKKNFDGVHALTNANFTLLQGEIHALVGENGAGKSTLIKILSGIHARDDGEILIDGKPVNIDNPAMSRDMGIAVIHQNFDLAPNLSVADNLLLGNEPTQFGSFVNAKQHKKLAQKCLENIGIKIDVSLPGEKLTTAQRQLVAIAKAVSSNARILIMDEPTSALATDEITHLLKLIKQMKEKGVSIIYISHKMEEIFDITDRVTIFRDGAFVGIKETTETTEEEIISMMVGRDLEDMFAKTCHPKDLTLLEAKNIYKKGVFNKTNFNIKQGEILGLYGLKGAGRSEMIRTLFGLDKLDKGEYIFRGEIIKIDSPQQAIKYGIACVPEDRQTQGLFPNMSVRENMLITSMDNVAKYSFINWSREREIAAEYVSHLNIRTSDTGQMITDLSGGNQQKVILARWLIGKPALLILDEPTAGIDVGAKSEIYSLINRLAAEDLGVILISSELPEILGMSDRILVMHQGEITGEFLREEASEEKIMHTIHSTTGVEAA